MIHRYCLCRHKPPTKTKVVVYGSKVIESAERKAYTHIMALPEADVRRKALLADVGQQINSAEVGELMYGSMTELSEVLAGYLYEEASPVEVLANDEDAPCDYVLNLCLPHTFLASSVDGIKQHAHLYVVNRVLEEWTSVVMPEIHETYAVKSAAEKSHIRRLALARSHYGRVESDVI